MPDNAPAGRRKDRGDSAGLWYSASPYYRVKTDGLRKGTRRVADEFVRKEHFEEFCVRMDGQFLALEKRMEQGFAHAEKAREQNLAQIDLRLDAVNQRFEAVNQRFEAVDKRFDDMNRNIDQRFDDMNRSMGQRFDDMNRSVEQRFDDMIRSINLRFDSLENRFDDLRKIVLIMLTALVGATVVSLIGAAVKYVFFSG